MLPKGTKMIQKLQRWIEDLEDNEWGYVRTKTPLMAKSDLYKISGHWDHYQDGMFILGDPQHDGEILALRPMTCPFQYYVYKNTQNPTEIFHIVWVRLQHFSEMKIREKCTDLQE